MNQHQVEVAEMDRRLRMKVRIASSLGMALLVIGALWGAGFEPGRLWSALHAQMAGELKVEIEEAPAAERVEPIALPKPAPLVADAKSLLESTSASVSVAPQQLHLVATRPGRNPREGTAHIGTNPAAPQTYAAGAILLNGARLVEIHSEYVILERDGERLRLRKYGAANVETTVSELAFVGTPEPRKPPELAQDDLSSVIRLSPYYENDVLVGMRMYPGRQSQTFAQLGLQAGDIAVAVEGGPIADPEAAMQMFQTIAEGAALSLTVRRASRLHTLRVDGSIVARAVSTEGGSTHVAALPPG